jgi:hypothetical protein
MFDMQPARATKPIALLSRTGQAMLLILVPLALVSGYRAWVQVFWLEFKPVLSLTEGAVVSTAVTTSGRTRVDVIVEVLQDGRVLLLTEQQVRSNGDGALDPRPRSAIVTGVITGQMWRTLRPGRATLRAVARGRPQFLRLPPPEIRTIGVLVAPGSGADGGRPAVQVP